MKAKAAERTEKKTFAASHQWFQRFNNRANLHYVSVSGEAASADEGIAKKFPINLKKSSMTVVMLLSKLSTWTRLAFSGKNMPEKTYISLKEKTMPGFQDAKDRLTLRLGGNASEDFKPKTTISLQS